MDAINDWVGIRSWRARVPGQDAAGALPMIAVCTVPGSLLAEDAVDVDIAEAYTSWFWATNRAEWRAARWLARIILRSKKLPPVANVHGVAACLLSEHHVLRGGDGSRMSAACSGLVTAILDDTEETPNA